MTALKGREHIPAFFIGDYMHPLRQFLLEIDERLRSKAMAARVQGEWNRPQSRPTVRIEPPASLAEISALEDRTGQALPEEVREVLGEVSREIHIEWSLRSRIPFGLRRRKPVLAVNLPDAFMRQCVGEAPDGTPCTPSRMVPHFIDGNMRFSIGDLENAFTAHAVILEDHTPKPFMCGSDARYFSSVHAFLSRGFPISVTPWQDWLAMDRRAGTGTMLQFSSDVFDTAASEIKLGLVQFLAAQAALGPISPDLRSIRVFSTGHAQLPESPELFCHAGFSVDTPNSLLWREWFWGGQPPEIPAALLARSGFPG